MKERKSIDRLYQENFKDFEVAPQPGVWKNIAKELEKDKRKKPFIIPLWFKLGGVAAVLALVLGGAWFLNSNFAETTPQVVFDTEEIKRPEINIPSENPRLQEIENLLNTIISEGNRISSEDNPAMNPENNEAIAQNENTQKSSENLSEKTQQKKEQNNRNNVLAEVEKTSEEIENIEKEPVFINPNDESETVIAENKTSEEIKEEKQTSNDSIAENALALLKEAKNSEEKEDLEISKTDKKRLSLRTFAAPVVYDNFGSGNAIDAQFANNPSNSNLSMAYGINIAYQLSEKIKIRSGIGKVSMSYDIEEIAFSAALTPNAISSINYDRNGDNVQIQSRPSNSNIDQMESSLAPSYSTRSMLGEINQQFGFIEVPLEIEYNLLDSKIGLNIIGGGSSLFLDENIITLNSSSQSSRLGEANNLNKMSFSTNIGLGVDYKLSEKFLINLEPVFKYQLNTFNDTRDVQPYFFGVYSGLSFKF